MLASACAKKEAEAPAAPVVNPFLTEWTAPFGTPPFGEIKEAHFMPAFQEGMARQKAEIAAITASTEPPTFANTVEAIERSGRLLRQGRPTSSSP